MRNVGGRNAAAAAQLRALAKDEHLSLQVVELDVTDDASVGNAVSAVIDQAGRIDVLVNNAGFAYIGITETYTVEQAQQIFDVNFFGVVRMNRGVLPYMRRQGRGLLVYISSAAGRLVSPIYGLYCASKFAMEALAESYHYQLSLLGIDTVIVQPGQYPSAAPNNFPAPADPARAAEYGELGETLRKSAADFIERYFSPDAPDPQEVADAVAALISMPAGERPLRVPVGVVAGLLNPLNDTAAQTQVAALERFGLARLAGITLHQRRLP
jgi:NAD(P)-dependent dehydrogenase (short-subunit alcohol dehydrogenase family)